MYGEIYDLDYLTIWLFISLKGNLADSKLIYFSTNRFGHDCKKCLYIISYINKKKLLAGQNMYIKLYLFQLEILQELFKLCCKTQIIFQLAVKPWISLVHSCLCYCTLKRNNLPHMKPPTCNTYSHGAQFCVHCHRLKLWIT